MTRDSARLFKGRTGPIVIGIGLMMAGLLFLFVIVPPIAFGILLILTGAILFSTYS